MVYCCRANAGAEFFSEHQKQLLLEAMVEEVYPSDEGIMRQGDPAEAFYIIEKVMLLPQPLLIPAV